MRFLLIACFACAVSIADMAGAADARSPAAQDYLTPYVGVFDITDNDSDSTLQLGVEYRFAPWRYGLRPTLGASVDVDGGLYGYAGLNWDIPLLDSLYLIPNFMAGAYHEGGSKDLGGALEFRSGIELAYQFPNQHRLGVAFNHISNASIYDKNPGAEAVLLNYSVPISVFSDSK